MTERVLGRLAAIVAAFALVVTLAPLQPASAQTAQGRYFADNAFQRIWERNDRPVEQLQTTRSWTWGPNSSFNGLEPYKQGPNGRRLVQYFDKARMEVNDPNRDRDDFNYVTNGLLVRELVSGKVAVGDKPEEHEAKEPSEEAVGGDPRTVNENAPTYASFREVASLSNDKPAENRVGLKVRQMFDKRSRVRDLPTEQQALGELVKIQVFDQNLKHNIPDKFWSFLTQTGAVYEGGRTIPNGSVFQPWEFVMGLPVTEPYWVQTKVAGIERYVLVQLFERRVLTYTPSNRPGFEVEMGNAGQHYYRWRYQRSDFGGDEGDGSRPKIETLERTELTATTARIEWTTSRVTTSRMEYGSTQDFGSLAGQNTEYVMTHNVLLERLTPNTVYYYRIISRDREGLIVDDSVHQFKTRPS